MAFSVNSPARRKSRTVGPQAVQCAATVWNKAVFDELSTHVGADKMDESLRMFAEDLSRKSLKIQAVADFTQQRCEVHDLASVSGFLGFEPLFRSCFNFLTKNRSSSLRRQAVVSEIEIALMELRPYLGSKLDRQG